MQDEQKNNFGNYFIYKCVYKWNTNEILLSKNNMRKTDTKAIEIDICLSNTCIYKNLLIMISNRRETGTILHAISITTNISAFCAAFLMWNNNKNNEQ